MVTVLPPLRSVFHTMRNVPSSSPFSAARATAALSQLAPPYSNRPIDTANGNSNVHYLTYSSAYPCFVLRY
jgi:hypothetical protein